MRTRGARLPDYKVHLNMRMQTRAGQPQIPGQVQQQASGGHFPPTRSSKSGPVKMRPAFRLPMAAQQQVSPLLKVICILIEGVCQFWEIVYCSPGVNMP